MTLRTGHPIHPHLEAVLGLVPAIWLGLLIGVSFIATPVKFAAPTLALGPALDVGRVTFGLFSKVEWGVAAILAIAVVLARFPPRRGAGMLVLVVALGLQALWLLPVLDARVAAVMAGTPPPPSWHHTAYAGLEIVKSGTLLVLALAGARHVYGNR
jgi:hypothetical protein